MSSNEWHNTEFRNIRFVNKCSHDIYVGSKMPAGENIDDSVCDIRNYDHLNNLPYSAISEGDQNKPQPCKDFKQIIAKIDGTESAGAGGGVHTYRVQLFNDGGHNKCNSTDDWCRNSFQVFPMVLNDRMTSNQITEEFDRAADFEGLTEFTFGADPTEELKAGDDNYDISVIMRHGACSAHSNPYENDYGYANTNPECQTNPLENNNILPFNNGVAYNTVDLAKYSHKGINKQASGCSLGIDAGCNNTPKKGNPPPPVTDFDRDNPQKTVPFYGCGIPRVYTPTGSSTEYTLKWGAPESDQWEVYTPGDVKVEEPQRSTILDEIRKEIVKCSYVQSKLNNEDESADSIFNFIPFELKALEDDGISTYEGCSTGTEPLTCEPATEGDPSTLATSCHRGYSFQYDDFVAGITCRPPLSSNGNPTYEITYCPENGSGDNNNCIGYWSRCNSECKKTYHITRRASGNGTPCSHRDGELMECQSGDCPRPVPDPPGPGPDPPGPGPDPPGPGPSDRATCSTLLSCISGMEIDPLKANMLCVGSRCDMAIDSDTCCKAIENSPSNVPSNSQTEEESGTSNRASLSNDNTRFVSQIDDRPMYDGSSLEKNTSHTNIMQSSNYNPVGIDEGSGYSFLSNISSTVSGLGNKSKSIGLQPNNFYW